MSLFLRHHSCSSVDALFNSETATFPLFPTQYTEVSSAYMYVSSEATEDGRSLKIKQIMLVLKLNSARLQLELTGSQIRRR